METKPTPKTCNECKALNSFIYNRYGNYYCWDKEGRKIFEGKDTLSVPTPKWCPKLAQLSNTNDISDPTCHS